MIGTQAVTPIAFLDSVNRRYGWHSALLKCMAGANTMTLLVTLACGHQTEYIVDIVAVMEIKSMTEELQFLDEMVSAQGRKCLCDATDNV